MVRPILPANKIIRETIMRLSVLALVMLATTASADTLTGFVTAITDGDTIVLLVDKTQHKVRLNGIDAPEKAQPYGSRSTENLSGLVFQKTVTADCPKVDRWGRLVCKVTVAGQDVGLAQVNTGVAWHYKKYENEQTIDDRVSYRKAEVEARGKRIGLWADAEPIPPWAWRKSR